MKLIQISRNDWISEEFLKKITVLRGFPDDNDSWGEDTTRSVLEFKDKNNETCGVYSTFTVDQIIEILNNL
jgi:hypothetical protein